MKHLWIIFLPLLMASVLTSCTDELKQAEDKIDALKDRLSTLEGKVKAINDNTHAVKVLLSEGITIEDYRMTSTGYTVTLSDGRALNITFGSSLTGVVPSVGVDGDGNWIVSVDGGKTWQAIEGATNVNDADGVIPLVKVDQFGYWNVSIDGGKTWNQILNALGLPTSADDGREAAGSYSFFTNVEYNEDDMRLHFLLNNGDSFSVQVLGSFYVQLQQYVEGDRIFRGESLTFPVVSKHIRNAVWKKVPEGFKAVFTDDGMTFKAPENGEPGLKEFELLTFSDEGYTSVITFKLTYDPDHILYDEFDRSYEVEEKGVTYNVPDPKRWNLNPRGLSDSDRYDSESYENVQVEPENSRLFMTSFKKGDDYRAASINTKNRITFGNCRVEICAFLYKNAQGAFHAFWLNTQTLSWPEGGEIDIMEHINHETTAHQTVHSNYTIYDSPMYDYTDPKYYDWFSSSNFPLKQGKPTYNPSEYHVFGVDLTDDWLIFHIDGKETFRYPNMHWESEEDITDLSWKNFADYYDVQDNRNGIGPRSDQAIVNETLKKRWREQWPFQNSDWYLIMNISIGGSWAGAVNDAELPINMYVDWVKITPLDKITPLE